MISPIQQGQLVPVNFIIVRLVKDGETIPNSSNCKIQNPNKTFWWGKPVNNISENPDESWIVFCSDQLRSLNGWVNLLACGQLVSEAYNKL